MMVRYEVTCYGPPSQLKIQKGDKVIVKGSVNEKSKLILADSIENLTDHGPTCKCQYPPFIKAVEKRVQLEEMKAKVVKAKKQGTVGQVTVNSEYIEFELEVPP